MDGYIFRALGDGESARDLFEGLVWITGQGDYTTLATVTVVLGFTIALAVGATRARGLPAISYIASAILFWLVTMVPTATVVVQDDQSESVWTVDHVPLGVAFVASLASGVGYWLADAYESAFVPVSAARFSQFGAVYPERVIETLKDLGPVTVTARESLQAFIVGCVLPELTGDADKTAALLDSADLWATVSASGWVNAARLVAMPDGQTLYCPAALSALSEILTDTELPALKKVLGARLAPSAVDPSAAVAQAVPQAESVLLGLSRSLDESLRQSLMTSALSDSARAAAVRDDAPLALAVALTRAQGNLASEINYRALARVAEDLLPKARNALEIMIIGLFPVVALISLAAGSGMGGVVRGWVMSLLALELWPAAASLVNFLLIERDSGVFGALLSAYGGDTLRAAALIRETGATSQAIAGALMMAVPVICFMIARGGTMAMGQLGGLLAPAQSAVGAQAGALAAGNVSQGNVSLANTISNNTRANKHDRSINAAAPATLHTESAWGAVTRDGGGAVTAVSRRPIDLGVSGSVSQALSRSHAVARSEELSLSSGRASAYSLSAALSGGQTAERDFARALSQGLSRSSALGESSDLSRASSSALRVSSEHAAARANEVSEGLTLSSGLGLGAGGGGGGAGGSGSPLSASAGLRADISDAQRLIDRASGGEAAVGSRESLSAYRQVRQAAERVAAEHGDLAVRREAARFLTSLSDSRERRLSQSAELRQGSSAVSALRQEDGAASRVAVDTSADLMRRAIATWGSPEAGLRALSEGSARQRLAGEERRERGDAISPRDDFGPGAILPAGERVGALYRDAAADLAGQAALQGERMAAAGRDAREDIARLRDGAEAAPAGWGETVTEAGRRLESDRSGLGAGAAEVALGRGVMIVARELYRQDNAERNLALRNAFLGGHGYREPGAIADQLRRGAAGDERMAEALRRIGQRGAARDEDWAELRQER